jgi:predicted transcriptional regulator
VVNDTRLTEHAVQIVTAFLSNNAVAAGDIPELIQQVRGALMSLVDRRAEGVPGPALRPAVPIKRSVTDAYIVCLDDGLRFKSLKRHLRSAYGMTPEEYRAKWGLPHDYPMVAPNYAEHRSQLAKKIGLGKRLSGKRK